MHIDQQTTSFPSSPVATRLSACSGPEHPLRLLSQTEKDPTEPLDDLLGICQEVYVHSPKYLLILVSLLTKGTYVETTDWNGRESLSLPGLRRGHSQPPLQHGKGWPELVCVDRGHMPARLPRGRPAWRPCKPRDLKGPQRMV